MAVSADESQVISVVINHLPQLKFINTNSTLSAHWVHATDISLDAKVLFPLRTKSAQ